MLEATLWHPVASAADVDAVPIAARLLECELVLWRDPVAGVQAWADRCPHRGTRLSRGRVVDGRLECAYHGWQFRARGVCAAIPALPGFAPTATHAARAYAVREAYGIVWVRLEGQGDGPPEVDGAPPRQVLTGPYEVATSAPRVVENFLDMSHFAFVHGGTLGDRAHAGVPHYEVERRADGAPRVPRYRVWQPRATADAERGAWVDYRYEVLGPYCALLFKQAGEGGAPREAYAIWVCPVEPESSRVWFTQFTTDTSTEGAALRAFQDTVFAEDRPVVESQRPRRLPLAAGEAHCAADRTSVAYREYLRNRGITFGVC